MNYKANFTNFLQSCDEKEKEIKALKTIIQKKRKSLLDVGGGCGSISLALESLFDEITIIEKNGHFKKNYLNSKANVFHTSIEEFNTKEKFDIIIASHVFPYLDASTKQLVMTKLKSYLNDDGLLIIIEMTKIGQIGYIKEMILKDKLISTHELIKKLLAEQNIVYQELSIKPKLITQSAEDLVDVIKFFAEKYNGHYEKSREELIKYVSDKLYVKEKNIYQMDYINRIMVIKKN